MSDPADHAALLLDAFVEAQARGEAADPEAWLAQDPARAAALRAALGADPLPELRLLASLHRAGQSVSQDASAGADAAEPPPGHSAVLTLPTVLLEAEGAPRHVAGGSLQSLVKREGPLHPRRACRLLRRAARELAPIHRAGFAHLDLSPAHLIDAEDKRVRVADRALARLAARPRGRQEGAAGAKPGLEAPEGEVPGDLDYLAPERARHLARVDARSDLYSLGCVLYFLLAGRPPFADRVGSKKILAHAMEPLRPLPTPPPEPVAALLEGLLRKDPARRIGSAEELIAALDLILGPSAPPPRRPLWPLLLAATLGMGLGLLALGWWWTL